jgi:flagellar motor switch protein FliG
MTLREFYAEVAANATISAEAKEIAGKYLDKFKEEDKAKDSKREANVALGNEILAKMEAGKKYLNSDIVAMFSGKYNSSKISYVLREILKDKVVSDDSTPKQYSKK